MAGTRFKHSWEQVQNPVKSVMAPNKSRKTQEELSQADRLRSCPLTLWDGHHKEGGRIEVG